MKTINVVLEQEDWYPVPSPRKANPAEASLAVPIPESVYRKYGRALARFELVCDELVRAVKQAQEQPQ
jgi:hypothetical protein